MSIFQINIPQELAIFFQKERNTSLIELNKSIKKICGINDFFENQSEIDDLYIEINNSNTFQKAVNRDEFGDFQTNSNLSEGVCKTIKNNTIHPEIIIEPTCGKGNFIISSLKEFDTITHIYGIEIFKPYIWQTKFSILEYFLLNKVERIPSINIIHADAFDFNYKSLYQKHPNNKILILGNPPWVTNAKLTTLKSKNLPRKSNFKKHKGLDAMTGKGNFDIAEYIAISLFDIFSHSNNYFAFLIKNSVVKNILKAQSVNRYQISNIKQYNINSKKEFNVSVNACLFVCKLGEGSDNTINEYDYYSNKFIKEYGWCNNKFVSNTKLYKNTKTIDGKSPFEWRQGVKHDLTKIMELERVNGHFINNNNDIVKIENDLVYGLLKSSDLKGNKITSTRKVTIITQKKVGQETKHIKGIYPKTYKYLLDNVDLFNRRKSSIYKNKPLFSIFGIGDYSFKPYKVAISGLYKTTNFSVVYPISDKPVMLDDTCYFIGFDNQSEAEITGFLLNKDITQKFIQSIAFTDSKRMITKDLLMRIDIQEIITNTSESEILKTGISFIDWENYKSKLINQNKNKQLSLFESLPTTKKYT